MALLLSIGQPRGFDLDAALSHACQLLKEGKHQVTVRDDAGHAISGEPLLECCRREKSVAAGKRR
jgi:hypothetical protein